MKGSFNRKINNKFLVIFIIGLLVTMLGSIGVNYYSSKQIDSRAKNIINDSLYEEVKNQVKFNVETVVSTAEESYRQRKGSVPEAELVQLILNELRTANYNKTGYYFVYQYDGVRLVAPENTAMEGKNLWDLTDKKGNRCVQDTIKLAQNGGGFYTYFWKNPATNREEDKLSYTAPLKLGSLELAVGTGTYLPMLEQAKTAVSKEIAGTARKSLVGAVAVGVVIMLIVLALLTQIVANLIVKPLKKMAEATGKMALGDCDVLVDVKSQDEIGTLAKSFNAMVDNIREGAQAVERIAVGDLEVQLAVRSEKDVLNKNINVMTQNLQSVTGDINMLADAAVVGNLTVRADAGKYNGDYKKMVTGINNTLDAVVNPLNDAKNTLTAMAVNDFTVEMQSDHYQGMLHQFAEEINKVNDRLLRVQEAIIKISQGDISLLEESLKRGKRSENDRLGPAMCDMMQTIKNLIDEVGHLTQAAVGGDLQARGNVEKFTGGYRQIVTGFNRALDAIVKPVNEAFVVLQEMAEGNLAVAVEGDYQGDHALLAQAVNHTIDSFNEVLGEFHSAVNQVATGAQQVSNSSQIMSQGAAEQASTTEEITASLSEIGNQTKQNAVNAAQANEIALTEQKQANDGSAQMEKMLEAMTAIDESSASISKIIKVIDEIAFQTNILALNAAVEAARAGQYGKGFAVVAEEVRNLAARSAGAAKETTALIESSIQKVEVGTRIANDTAQSLNLIVGGVAQAANLIGGIATASNEQAAGIAQVNLGMGQIAQVTQTNTATAEEIAATSEELAARAEVLKEMVRKFQLKDDHLSGDGSDRDSKLSTSQLPVAAKPAKAPVKEAERLIDSKGFGKY